MNRDYDTFNYDERLYDAMTADVIGAGGIGSTGVELIDTDDQVALLSQGQDDVVLI